MLGLEKTVNRRRFNDFKIRFEKFSFFGFHRCLIPINPANSFLIVVGYIYSCITPNSFVNVASLLSIGVSVFHRRLDDA